MGKYVPKSKEWFVERIGKRIYRDAMRHCCAVCDDVAERGLVVHNDMHADYLACTDADFGAEGHYCNYRDIK